MPKLISSKYLQQFRKSMYQVMDGIGAQYLLKANMATGRFVTQEHFKKIVPLSSCFPFYLWASFDEENIDNIDTMNPVMRMISMMYSVDKDIWSYPSTKHTLSEILQTELESLKLLQVTPPVTASVAAPEEAVDLRIVKSEPGQRACGSKRCAVIIAGLREQLLTRSDPEAEAVQAAVDGFKVDCERVKMGYKGEDAISVLKCPAQPGCPYYMSRGKINAYNFERHIKRQHPAIHRVLIAPICGAPPSDACVVEVADSQATEGVSSVEGADVIEVAEGVTVAGSPVRKRRNVPLRRVRQ
ncbi:hypothetical protein HDE_04560 [Halotydeus destructor]|nr:hypothetical protein HDE_04560 [Halotydeus destructor]